MRRSLMILSLCVLLAACGTPAQPPQAARSAAYPAPATATRAAYPPPASATPTLLAVTATPRPTLTPTPAGPRPTAAPAPFSATMKRLPLDPPGGYVVGWSANGTQILYQIASSPGEGFALFDLQTQQARLIIQDGMETLLTPQLRAAWDQAHNAIVYARAKTDTTVDIVAVDLSGTLLRAFATDVSVSDSSIGTNGLVGVRAANQLTRMRLGEPDQVETLPDTGDQLQADYHQIWIAPDGQHYAVANGHGLQLFVAGSSQPLQSFDFDDPGVVQGLIWSPDSRAIYYQRLSTELPADYYGTYVQPITETVPQELEHHMRLPGSGDIPRGATWSLDSRWLVIGLGPIPHCAGTREGCRASLVIMNPFGTEASVILDAEFGVGSDAAWSSDGTQIAEPCATLLSGTAEKPNRIASEMCIFTLKEQTTPRRRSTRRPTSATAAITPFGSRPLTRPATRRRRRRRPASTACRRPAV